MKFSLDNIVNIKDLVSELSAGLIKLTLEENIEGFLVKDIKFRRKEKIVVKNQADFIPSKFIILDQVGNGVISRQYSPARVGESEIYPTPTEWTSSQIFLVNTGKEPVIATIYFMR